MGRDKKLAKKESMGRDKTPATSRSSREDVSMKTQIQEFEDAFRFLDKDGDGYITMEELALALKSLDQKPTKKELRRMIEEVDANANGTIELGKFLNLMARKIKESDADMAMKEAFKVFDKDQDGYISPNELREGMINLGEKLTDDELDAMMVEADLDGDGRINYNEFVRMMLAG